MERRFFVAAGQWEIIVKWEADRRVPHAVPFVEQLWNIEIVVECVEGWGPSPFKLSQTQESPLWTSHHLPEFRRKVSSLSPKFHFSSARGREEQKWVGNNSQENIRFFIFDMVW